MSTPMRPPRSAALSCLAAASFLFTATVLQATNLVSNSDFSGPTLKPWSISQGGGLRIPTSNGERQLLFPARPIAEKERVTQSLPPSEFKQGGRFRLSCRFRSHGLNTAEAKQFITLKLKAKSGKQTIEQLELKPKGDEGWDTVDKEILISGEIEEAKLSIQTDNRTGELAIAGVKLERIAPNEDLVLFSLLRPGGATSEGNDLQKACDLVVTTNPAGAKLATVCRTFYDREAVTFLLEMEGGQPKGSDSVEIWISPNGSKYFQFLIEKNGRTQTFARTDGNLTSLKTSTEATITTRDKTWTAILRVPFSAIEATLPKDNERWGFNIARNGITSDGARETSSWSQVAALEQTKRFGKLSFYSRGEVQADLAYWTDTKHDPLLRRVRVSGLEIAQAADQQQQPQLASFWTYDPFDADRKAGAAWECRGLTEKTSAKNVRATKTDYPEFFETADRFNRTLLELSKADEETGLLVRAEAYWKRESDNSNQLQKRLKGIETHLDLVFQKYSDCFRANWDKSRLNEANAELLEINSEIETVRSGAQSSLGSLQDELKAKALWIALPTEIEPNDERRDSNGVPQRFWFTAMRSQGTEPLDRYFPEFRSHNIDWPMIAATSSAPGRYELPNINAAIKRLSSSNAKFNLQTLFGLESYQAPVPKWLEDEIANDPTILAATEDGLKIGTSKVPAPNMDLSIRWGINIEHPKAINFAREYLTHIVHEANRSKQLDFVVTGWEDSMSLKMHNGKSQAKVRRQRGYDAVSQRSFRDELRDRYGSIEALNGKWKSPQYGSFDEITPPSDYNLTPASRATGLTYEWGRWQRKSHFRWASHLRRFVKEAAQSVPVVTDNSHLLMAGTGLEAMRGPSADIISFHSNPTREDAMFAYLGSIARERGVTLGCFENYCMMYSRLEGEDERLGAHSLRRQFSSFIARDVRLLTFWLNYLAQPTPYIAAYGGGVLRLDNDQTILRWPSTEIVRFINQVRRVERPLVDSRPAQGRLAVIIPDSSNIQLAAVYGTARPSGAEMDQIIKFHNNILSETNIAAEYLHEETLAGTEEDLSRFDAVFIANAPYLQKEALMKLSAWCRQPGKTIFAAGSLGFYDEFGNDNPPADSPLRVAFPSLSLNPDRPLNVEESAGTKGDLLEEIQFGKGKLVRLRGEMDEFAASPPHLKRLQEAVREATPQAFSLHGEKIRLQVRHGIEGDTYLLISNHDVRAGQSFKVTIEGRFKGVYDLLIPGWLPLPTIEQGNRTVFSGMLGPGDWTLLKLDQTKVTSKAKL